MSKTGLLADCLAAFIEAEIVEKRIITVKKEHAIQVIEHFENLLNFHTTENVQSTKYCLMKIFL